MMWRPRAAHLTLVMVLLVIATAGWPQSAAAMPFAQLADVSCGSLGDCAAVGTAPASDRDTAIVYTLRGGAWTTGTTASLPADAVTGSASFSFLRAVSCPAVGSCLAVGSYTNQAGASAPLLLPEAGGSWAAGTTAALPTNAAGGMRLAVTLDAVTCVSAGNCTA